MNRKLLVGLFLFFAVVGISLVGDQPQAMGGWWHRAANCGGWGGYYGGGGCYGYTGCYGGWSGCYGGYTGCYGGWGGCYGWSGCGGYGGYGGYGGVVYSGTAGCCGDNGVIMDGKSSGAIQKDGEVSEEPTPAEPANPEPAAAGASASLNLSVPSDAKVVINDHVTSSTGGVRQYISRGLRPNMEYQFSIRAEVVRNGAKVERTKVVRVRANESAEVSFDFEVPQVASVAR